MAQSVERRLGKAEVTGSIPVSSLHEKSEKPDDYRLFGFFFLQKKEVREGYGQLNTLFQRSRSMVE